MTLKAIKTALITLMKTAYSSDDYKYYSMAVTEGYTRPCIFTDIQIDGSEALGYNTYHHRGHFDIEFLQKVIDEGAALDFFDAMKSLFGLYVAVDDRVVKVLGMDYSYSGTGDNVMMISVDLEWTDEITHADLPGADSTMESLEYTQELTIDYEE